MTETYIHPNLGGRYDPDAELKEELAGPEDTMQGDNNNSPGPDLDFTNLTALLPHTAIHDRDLKCDITNNMVVKWDEAFRRALEEGLDDSARLFKKGRDELLLLLLWPKEEQNKERKSDEGNE